MSDASEPNPTLMAFEAIVRQRCVSAIYNRTRMTLAPHILFTRDGQIYLDALIVSRDFIVPSQEKIGTFKLDGLKSLTLTERPFAIHPLFDATLDKYVGQTLMAVEQGAVAA